MTSSSSSSSSSISIPRGLKYHVFISFRGKDTRMNFAGHLYDALCRNGIKVFFDDEELKKGEEISPALEKAIGESWIAVVIFSINYASSSWCLEELAKVMENKTKLVLPVFYKVEPSDLRHEKGSYAEALSKHESRITEKWKIDRWRLALHKAAQLSGWHFMTGQMYEHKFIHNIVEYVSQRISSLRHGDKSIGQHVIVRSEKEQKERDLMRKASAETHKDKRLCTVNDKHILQHTITGSDEKIESLTLAGTEDKIVVYHTSVRGVRKTYSDCSRVMMILNNIGVAVDERDINLNSSYKEELKNALGNINVSLPQVFIRGKYVGNADIMEQLNESGVLETLLKGFPIQSTENGCSKCGNARFVSCSRCSGSWRAIIICQYCNEKGLIRCPSCC